METLYVKLNFGEAIDSKRKLLSTEINLLNIIKKINSYKEVKKLEFARKILLKSKLKEVNEKINELRASLPRSKIPEMKEKEVEEEIERGIEEKTKKLELEEELIEIREKLARLG